MTQADKKKFRMSAKWKAFRQKMRKLHHAQDFVTGQPLKRNWNLHHMDLRSERYTDLSDPDVFMPLNKETHKLVHYLYNALMKDPLVLQRLNILIYKMIELN